MNFFDPFEVAPIEAQDWKAVDRYLGLPNNERLWSIAKQIDDLHKGQRDSTESWRTREHRFIGLAGERAFARIFELKMDFRLLRWGNARQNFRLRDGRVVDVVTRTWQNPLNPAIQPELTLRHKGNKTSNKTLVLVYYCGNHYEPIIVGHITEKEAREIGREDQFRDGIENIVVSPVLLNDPVELLIDHKPQSPWIRAHSERQAMIRAAITHMEELESKKAQQTEMQL